MCSDSKRFSRVVLEKHFESLCCYFLFADSKFDACFLLKFGVCSKIVNAHVHIVAKNAWSTGPGVDSVTSGGILKVKITARSCCMNRSFTSGAVSELLDGASYNF